MKTECLEFCQDISFSKLDLLIWCNTSQLSESYFADINKIILIFLWRLRKLKRANTILKGRSKVRELTASDFKAYYAAKSLQLCPTLCDPIDGSPPGFPVPGILQARTLEWVAISFSNAWKWKVKVKSLSRVRLLATPWTTAHQAPPSMGFSRQEYWSGVPSPSPKAYYKTIVIKTM